MITLHPSHHAIRRARQRLNWSRHALERMLERVYYDGISAGDCAGALLKYLRARQTSATVVTRINGEHLFLFSRENPHEATLMTVYNLPMELRRPSLRARLASLALAA